MKKVFGFFSNKAKKNKLFKITVAILFIAIIISGGFLVKTIFSLKNSNVSIAQVSKNLNTYDMSIVMDKEYEFSAVQKIDYKNNYNVSLSVVKFNIYSQAFSEGVVNKPVSDTSVNQAYPNGKSYGTFHINSVEVAGQKSDFIYDGVDKNVLVVDVGGLMHNQNIEIKIDYEFTLPNINHRYGYGDNTINVANFYPVASVFENDEFMTKPYNYNGDPFYTDMANYNVKITVPTKYTVAHTGNVVSVNESGENQKTYDISAKAVRDFAFVMSDKFEVLSRKYKNTTINYYYYNDENAEQNLNTAYDSIATFSNLFGEYPYSVYNVVKTNFLHGGMEYPNLVYISDTVTDLKEYKNVIIHETAHQWWYQLVGSNAFSTPWLDEGLTEFSTVLFYENNPNYEMSASDVVVNTTNSYASFIEFCEKIVPQVNTSMNRSLEEYTSELEYVYMTYAKGMLLFENLRDFVGEKNFNKAIKSYYNEGKFKNVTPELLISVFEKSTLRDVRSFINSWIEGKVVIRAINK